MKVCPDFSKPFQVARSKFGKTNIIEEKMIFQIWAVLCGQVPFVTD